MDLNFYSDLSDGCAQNVDSEFLDTQAYGGYSEGNKVTRHYQYLIGNVGFYWWKLLITLLPANGLFQFPEGGDSYLTISGAGHPFLSAEVS